MKISKKFACVIAAITLSLTACASGGDSGQDATNSGTDQNSGYTKIDFEKKEPLKIGYSVYDLQNPYWQSYVAGVKAAGAKYGAEVVVVDQKSNQANQVSGSLDLVNQGVSALIITPVQPSALTTTVEAAHEAKIPVVVGDIGAVGDYDAYLLSNNYEGGKVAANYLIEKTQSIAGPVKVGVIELHPGSVVGEQRVAGFKDALEGNSKFEIVASLDGNDTVDGGFAAAQDMLSANPDLQVIYAANDDSAIGAQRALETAGKSVKDGFTLIGFDGSDGAQSLIEQGLMSGTVAQDPYGQGWRAVEIALGYLDGKVPEFDEEDTRTVFFPVELVTSDNLKDFQESRSAQK